MSITLSRQSRIGYCIFSDFNDRTIWSGIQYHILQAIKKRFRNVVPIHIFNVVKGGIGSDFFDNFIFFKKISPLIDHELKKNQCDAFVIPSNFNPIFLKTNVPIIGIFDGAFNDDISFTGVYERYAIYRKAIKRRLLKKISKFIFSSEWGCESLLKSKQFDGHRMWIVPFGANLEITDTTRKILARRQKPSDVCRLLFVGNEWRRKGGSIAFNTMVELNKRGINTELIVCGDRPPSEIRHNKLRVIGYLNKNSVKQSAMLNGFYRNANFFLLPSRADVTPIVLCEAAAWGLPVISTKTGGIPEVVKDGVTGHLLPLNASYLKYADKIQDMWDDRHKYMRFCRNARQRYEAVLNWDVWGKKFANVLLR